MKHQIEFKLPAVSERDARRQRDLFDSLVVDGAADVSAEALRSALRNAGLRDDDARLADLHARLDEHGDLRIGFEDFCAITAEGFLLIEKVLTGSLIVPDFADFTRELEAIFAAVEPNTGGAVADYIPQLGRVDPEQFGVGVCTVDGQRHAIGDAKVPFCLQSACKPILYMLALEENGEETVHRHMGREPSGHAFNELTLDRNGLPHNPMLNAGGIMSCSLIGGGDSAADRFDYVMRMFRDLGGGVRPGFDNPTYLSERQTADRNFALGYSMRENGAFPNGAELVEVLEFYFQSCSIESDADTVAVMMATLANGGICPVTGKRVLEPATVRKCLALMSSCGMYDFSGEWAFVTGLPAKSGVSGVVAVVVPGVLGLGLWSPRLDENGNSVRGIGFCRELVERFALHRFDTVDEHGKLDPRRPRESVRRARLDDLYWAASRGDLAEIRRLVARGVALDSADYDGRTALHLAASEGHADVVSFLIARGVPNAPRDRWGNTPLDDAGREGHAAVVGALERAGAA